MQYTYDDLQAILDDMEKYGGSFVRLIPELYRRADALNKAKILTTWSNYFEDYFKKF